MKGSTGFCAKTSRKSPLMVMMRQSWGTVVSLAKNDCSSKSYPLFCLEIPYEKRESQHLFTLLFTQYLLDTVYAMRDKVEEI